MSSKTQRVSGAKTALAPKQTQCAKLLDSTAADSLGTSGTNRRFSAAILSRSIFHTPSSDSHRENTSRTQMRLFRKLSAGSLVVGITLSILFLISLVLAWQANSNILILGQKRFAKEIANTSVEREKGLSGRASLPASHAMVFVFDSDGQYCFWMKDMKFAVDMIWLDANKKVVHIEKDVQPTSYPDVFCPDKQARYVVEVNAGLISQLGVKTGQPVKF